MWDGWEVVIWLGGGVVEWEYTIEVRSWMVDCEDSEHCVP